MKTFTQKGLAGPIPDPNPQQVKKLHKLKQTLNPMASGFVLKLKFIPKK